VLLLATGIGETEVNEFDLVFLHHLHYVCDGLGHQILLLHGCKKNCPAHNAAFVPKVAASAIRQTSLFCLEKACNFWRAPERSIVTWGEIHICAQFWCNI
jgi:hypothetical protein